MCQILRSYFHSKRSDVDIVLLYGGTDQSSLPFYESLQRCSRILGPDGKLQFRMHCTVVDALSNVYHGLLPWEESVGFVDEAMIANFMHPPGEDVLVLVCGPPVMCREIKTLLFHLG